MQECRSQTVERALKVFPKGRGCASEVQAAQVCEERWELKIAQLGVDISLHSKNARNRGQSMKKKPMSERVHPLRGVRLKCE